MSGQTAAPAQPSPAAASPREEAGAMSALFRPRGIAIVGASRTPGKLGHAMAESLGSYGGPVALVNSRSPDPAGGDHASLADAAQAHAYTLDLAVLCVPAPLCADAVRAAGTAGIGAALVCAGGFAEVDAEGAAHQQDLVAAATETGVRLLGPNTSGFLSPGAGLFATFVPGARAVRPGPVAVVAASGGVNHALAFLLDEAGLGVSLAVGLGNAAGVSAPDVLEHLAQDPDTRVVLLHVESVAEGSRLLDAVGQVADRKPVVALVVGRSDVGAFAQSHTGALATEWRTTRALLREAGAVLVDDERELVDAAAALSAVRLPAASRAGVGIVTAQAGPGLLLLDALRSAGVHVPTLAAATQDQLATMLPPMTYQANPVDTGRPGEGFGEVLAAVAADPEVDVVAGYALAEPGSLDLPRALRGLRDSTDRPVVFALGGTTADTEDDRKALAQAGIPAVSSPSALARGVRALVEDAHAAYRRGLVREALAAPPRATATAPHGPLDEDQAKSAVEALGIATPRRLACDTAGQARRALDTLSAPLAVKLLDETVLHKTEVGGVVLGVRTPDELAAAVAQLESVGAQRFLVEEMAPDGVDLLVGARRDPVFGPVVALAVGGTATEALADVSIRSAPLSLPEAESMPDDLAARALLQGWRGGPVVDRTELATVLCALGDLLVASPDVAEIDLNPLRLTRGGLLALDAVITTRES